MKVEWDKAKAAENIRKHGISFEEAETIFFDPLAETLKDEDHSLAEVRFVTIGYALTGHLLVVAHTERGSRLRLISARRATARERKRHVGRKC